MRLCTRRQFLITSGVGVTGLTGCADDDTQATQSDSSPARIDLSSTGYTSTGIPPVATAVANIDVRGIKVSDIDSGGGVYFGLRNTETDKKIEITADTEIVDRLVESVVVTLDFIEPTAEFNSNPAVSFDTEDVPVNISGDTELFRTQSTASSYQASIRDDTGPLLTTPVRRIGSQYPGSLLQTAAGETLRFEVPRLGLSDVSFRLEIDEVPLDSDEETRRMREPFEPQDGALTAEIDRDALTDDSRVDFRSVDGVAYASDADFTPYSQVLAFPGVGEIARQQAPAVYATSIDTSPTAVEVGEEIVVEFTVRNIGQSAGSESNVNLSVIPKAGPIPSEAQSTYDVGELAPGETTSSRLWYTPDLDDVGELRLFVSGNATNQTVQGVATVSVQ